MQERSDTRSIQAARHASAKHPSTKRYGQVRPLSDVEPAEDEDFDDDEPAPPSSHLACVLIVAFGLLAAGLSILHELGHDVFGQNDADTRSGSGHDAIVITKQLVLPTPPEAPPLSLPPSPVPLDLSLGIPTGETMPSAGKPHHQHHSATSRYGDFALAGLHVAPPPPQQILALWPSQAPSAPPPPPLAPSPPPSIQVITDRYLRNPTREPWPEDGLLVDAGLLVHCFDGHEDAVRPWLPKIGGGLHGTSDVSTSFIFADQCRTDSYVRRRAPGDFLFDHGCRKGGIIFRPGASRILCGNAQDADGACHDDSWRPSEIHLRLRQETIARANIDPYKARRNNNYNEFLVDGKGAWYDLLPGVIEAFLVGTKEGIGDVRNRFAEAYGLSVQNIPTLGFTCDCEQPFVIADIVPFDPCAGGRYRIVG